MTRCPRCGLRLRDEAPLCPTHGPAPSAAVSCRSDAAISSALQSSLHSAGYRLTALLGRGGFGEVYAAERTSDEPSLAIKLALCNQPGAIDSLLREEAALRAVGPPHVPHVFDSGELPGAYYLAMERIDTPTLARRMVELAGPAPIEVLRSLAYALLTPIEAVHEHGLVHCDLKPENIFVDQLGSARLVDFGLARPLASQARDIEQTDATDDAGTAEYMSPEQCDGLPCDRSSDIYSVGVLLYELLSGAPPFWGQAAEVREAHRSRRPPPLSPRLRCPPDLEQLVRRCLAKDRTRRFSDVAALRGALDHALGARLPSLRPPSLRPSIMRLARHSLPPRLAPASKEKRAMGLVFFESTSGVGHVQSLVMSSGGQIVHTSGAQYVAAFGHDVSDNPARVALLAAHRILAANITQRLLVDVATVTVQSRPDGSRRILSALLTKADRYPTAADPVGVSFTGAAREVLPDLGLRALSRRPDRYTLHADQNANELTALGAQLSPLVGRDEVLCDMRESAEQTRQTGTPTLVTVLAPAGYGRTHLAGVVAQDLREHFEVIRLSAQAAGVAPVLRELLRRALDLPATEPEHYQARLGDAGEATWAAVAHALGVIDADHPEVRRLAAAPGALRFAAARAAGEALQRRAAGRPVALLLDDAHFADEATLDALEYATIKGARVSIWVCVLAPPSFTGSRPSWGARAARSERIALSELAPRQAVELARQLLLPAQYTPEAVLLRLAERTQGVPRLLVELVRGLKRDGFVRKSERGTGYFLATDELDKLPDLPIVQWNATREIEALPTSLAGHARLASVLGTNFTSAELEALVAVLDRGDSPADMQLDATVGVQRLIDSGILLRHHSGLINFRYDMLRDMIYKLVPEAQRRRLHRAAFEAYCSLDMPESARLPRLATHAARCGERDFAAIAYLDLAARMVGVQAYLEAEAAYSGALENLADSDERAIDVARGRGLMRWRLGRSEAALADLRKGRELARARAALDREQEIMLDEATVLDWHREFSGSTALVRAVEAMNAPLSPLLRARLAMGIARCHLRQGEVEATIRVGNEAVQLAAALGDDGYETRTISQLMVATCYAADSKLDLARQTFEQLIAEAESRGDLHQVAAALGNRALLWHGLRDTERLFADLERSSQLARELGEAPLEFVGVYNLAESEYVLGKLPSARDNAQRMLELARQQFGELNREVSSSELLLARIALYDDDLPRAQQHAQNIRARVARGRAVGDPEVELEPAPLILLEMVELGSSQASPEAWQSLLVRGRSTELQPMELAELLEHAVLAAAQLGAWTLSREVYGELLELMHQKPSLIDERITTRLTPIFADTP